MSKFLSALSTTLISESPKLHRLLSPLVYQSDIAKREITVPTGFETDFASVPRLPLAFLICGDVGDEAAVVHDYLYRGAYMARELCDSIFKEALIASGVSSWKASIMHVGVRSFGWRFYKKYRRQ